MWAGAQLEMQMCKLTVDRWDRNDCNIWGVRTLLRLVKALDHD